MKSTADRDFIRVFTDIHEHLLNRGIKPEYTRLNNKASTAFQIEKPKDIDFQPAPPGMHRRNAADRTISTFKDQFIAGIFTTDP